MEDRIVPLAVGCLVALLSALGVVLARKPVHGAVALLIHSLALAALYLMLGGELVAMAQVIIYSGAIVVLFLFVVLLLPQGGREGGPDRVRVLAAAIGGGTLFAALVFTLTAARQLPASGPAPTGGVAPVGRALFGAQLVPFELTAILLLVAILGAVTIWRRQEGGTHKTGAGEP